MPGVQSTPASPCIGLCEINNDNGYCRGCWRTLEEIMDWLGTDDGDKHAVLKQLDARRKSSDNEH